MIMLDFCFCKKNLIGKGQCAGRCSEVAKAESWEVHYYSVSCLPSSSPPPLMEASVTSPPITQMQIHRDTSPPPLMETSSRCLNCLPTSPSTDSLQIHSFPSPHPPYRMETFRVSKLKILMEIPEDVPVNMWTRAARSSEKTLIAREESKYLNSTP